MEYNMNGSVMNTYKILLSDFGGNHLEDLDMDGKMLLYIYRVIWRILNSSRSVQFLVVVSCEHTTETSDSIK